MIEHAQISARIGKKLLSVASLKQSPSTLIETVQDLSQQLERWRATLPPSLNFETSFSPPYFRSTRELNRHLYLRLVYHGSQTAIHTIFFYPWISAICGVSPQNPEHEAQIAQSTHIVACAARSIIQATKTIRIDSASPQW